MNEENSVKTPGFFLPIAIALVGVVLGIVAIFVAASGKGQQDSLTQKLTEATDKVSQYDQRIAKLEENLRIASESINTTAMKAASLEEGIRGLGQQTQVIVNKLAEEIAAIKTSGRAGTAATAHTPVQTGATGGATEAAKPAANAAEGNVHVVKSGDTFTKIARQYDVSVEAIEKANPNTSSARLQIGQKIKIPSKQ